MLVGLTARVAGLLATLVCVTPSDHATVHGPTPVNVAESVALLPWQIVVLPLTAAVGGAATVTAWLQVFVQPLALVMFNVNVNNPALVALMDTV